MAVMAVQATRLTPFSGETGFNDREQISSWAQAAVRTAVNANLMKGCPDNCFRPQDNASRAEAVTVILNLLK
ncbi:MAG: S-layer homology domain-containing protein [Syntrophomonadaceae bacterium]